MPPPPATRCAARRANRSTSRSAQATDVVPRSLLDVRERLVNSKCLKPRERSDLISAVNSVARQMRGPGAAREHVDLAAIKIDLTTLDADLRALPERAIGVKESPFRNTISRFRKALRVTGVPLVDGHGRVPFSSAWADLVQRLILTADEQVVVNGFAAWCSLERIEPLNVTEATFDQFEPVHARLRDRQRDAKSGRQMLLRLRQTWNEKVVGAGLVGSSTVPVQHKHDWYSYPEHAWRKAFSDEIAAWKHFTQHCDSLDPMAPRRVGPVTATNEAEDIRAMASAYCRAAGKPPTAIKTIADIVSAEAAEQIANFMLNRTAMRQGVNDTAIRRSDGAYAAARLLLKLACYWVKTSPAVRTHLSQLALNLGPSRHRADRKLPLSEKTRDVLRAFLDPELAERFRCLPRDVFVEHDWNKEPTRRDAIRLSVAFALLLLMVAPAMPGRASSLKLGEHVIQEAGHSDPIWLVTWTGGRGKVARSFEYEFSGEPLRLLDLYVQRVRPLLAEADCPYLFPGRGGSSKNASWFSQQIAGLCKKRLGVSVSARLVPYVLATLVLLGPSGPGEHAHQLARRYLGHASRKKHDPLLEAIKGWVSGPRSDQRLETRSARLAKPKPAAPIRRQHVS